MGASSLFVPDPDEQFWPPELGVPNATGSQNDVRYAYFNGACRLAVKTGGEVWVYDTLDHQIGGFSQQQGSGGSITFNSQYGTVNLSLLPVTMRNGQPVAKAPAPAPMPQQPTFSPSPPATGIPSNAAITSPLLEKLGDLKAKGILTDEEFSRKKAELLSRL
jgi:hypothetical protein